MEELSSNSKVGSMVTWATMDELVHIGRLKEWDSNVAIIDEYPGKEVAVEV